MQLYNNEKLTDMNKMLFKFEKVFKNITKFYILYRMGQK